MSAAQQLKCPTRGVGHPWDSLGHFGLMNIEQLRKYCLALPGATEDIKWGADLCFSVGGKMFCVTGADSLASGLSIKCTPEKFEELIEREGVDPAAYVGRYKWVRISDLD